MDQLLDNTDPRKVAANMQVLLKHKGQTETLTEDVIGHRISHKLSTDASSTELATGVRTSWRTLIKKKSPQTQKQYVRYIKSFQAYMATLFADSGKDTEVFYPT
jgi:hypothetical protein